MMITDQDLREYLLGELPEDRVAAIEQQILEEKDDKLFERTEAMEGDLLAACARGELSPEERQRVLSRLAASPEGQARLALAQGLTRLADEEKKRLGGTVLPFRPRPALPARWSTRVAAIAASLAMAVGMFWLARQTVSPVGVHITYDPPAQVDPGQRAPQAPPTPTIQPKEAPAAPGQGTQIAGATPAPAPTPTPEPTPEVSVPSILQVPLTLAYATRSGVASEIAKIEVQQGTKTVEILLQLMKGEEATSFRAVLLDAADEKILQWEQIEATDNQAGGVIMIPIPTTEIPPGKYAIEVRGLTSEGDYELLGKPAFEVRRP